MNKRTNIKWVKTLNKFTGSLTHVLSICHYYLLDLNRNVNHP